MCLLMYMLKKNTGLSPCIRIKEYGEVSGHTDTYSVCVVLYMWAYLEILLNVNLFEQIAVTAGEELLTSVSAFEKSHCLVQDVTIS